MTLERLSDGHVSMQQLYS